MSDIIFYWSNGYLRELASLIKSPAINVSSVNFTPESIRSLRSVEVVFLPSCDLETEYANGLQEEFNKYGVVSIVKNVFTTKRNQSKGGS